MQMLKMQHLPLQVNEITKEIVRKYCFRIYYYAGWEFFF